MTQKWLWQWIASQTHFCDETPQKCTGFEAIQLRKSPLELCTGYCSPEPSLQQVRPQHISSTTYWPHCTTDIRKDDLDISQESFQCCNSNHTLLEGFSVWFYRGKKNQNKPQTESNQIISNQHYSVIKILEHKIWFLKFN